MGQSCLSRLTDEINEGDLQKVKQTLPELGDINTIDIDKHSLIAYTAARGHLGIIEHLINKEIDVNRVGRNGKHALTTAVENKLSDVVELLVKHSADLNCKDDRGDTPLIIAVKRDYEDIAKFLIDKGASLTISGDKGMMPLSYAVQNQNEKMMRLLLDNGAHLTIHTALLTAISRRDLKTVQFLQQYNKAWVTLNHHIDGYTPLTKAVEVQNIKIVKFLVENGADVNQMDEQKRTPLSVAVLKQDICIIKYLIEKGVKADQVIVKSKKIETLNTDFKLYLCDLKEKVIGRKKKHMYIILYSQ